MKGQSLVEMVRNIGPEETSDLIIDLLELEESDKRKIKPSDLSLRELWEAFVGPVGETLAFAQNRRGYVSLQESAAVNSSLYQILAGKMVSDTVIMGYDRIDHIGDQLVTVIPTKQRYDKVPGWTPTQGVKTVLEGQPYENTGFGHKYVGTGEVFKKGRKLQITEEAIFFDETASILMQAEELGKDARLEQEETILRAVLGIDVCYFPTDTGTALYAATPQLKTSNPLSDWTNVEAAETTLADTTDEEGNTIMISPNLILVPQALKYTAKRIFSAYEVREDTPTSSKVRTTNGPNPMMNAYQTLSSPLIHKLQERASIGASEASSSWWIGDFKKQFFWKELWPIQTLRAKPGHPDEFDSDVVAQFKVRYYGGIYAKDFRYVQKNKAS